MSIGDKIGLDDGEVRRSLQGMSPAAKIAAVQMILRTMLKGACQQAGLTLQQFARIDPDLCRAVDNFPSMPRHHIDCLPAQYRNVFLRAYSWAQITPPDATAADKN